MTDREAGSDAGDDTRTAGTDPETSEDTTSGGAPEQPDKPDAAVYGMADDTDEAGE